MDRASGRHDAGRAWSELGVAADLRLRSVELWSIELPLREPIATSVAVHRMRPLVLVHLRADHAGEIVDGWGECAALEDTTFDAEDAAAAYVGLEQVLVPALVETARGRLPGPHAVRGLRGSGGTGPLAFATLEMAVADAHLRAEDRSLASVLGSEASCIEIGAVLGMADPTQLVERAGRLVDEGYRRVKLKVGPGHDVEPLAALVAAYPRLSLQADANGSYVEGDTSVLRELDGFGLLCLEQPFARDQFDAHARLARAIRTPVCLDESLDGPDQVARAVAIGACSVVCVKPARLGGIGAAIEVVESCRTAGVPLWIGGMFESGYARGVNVAVAAMGGFSWPGDLAPSESYLAEDLVPPVVPGRHGPEGRLVVPVPGGPGMGTPPDPAVLERRAIRRVVIEATR